MADEIITNNLEVEEDVPDQDTISASDVVVKNITLYSKDNIAGQAPNMYDGFKAIHRRIIWALGTSEKPTAVSSLVGRVMDLYHPHGDNSILDAIIRLMQPFNNQIPLIMHDGSVGTYSGQPPAAGRYLHCWATEFVKDVFFTNVNKETLQYQKAEFYDGIEPSYLIPRIPTALLIGTFGLYIGYRSDIISLNFNNLCDLVLKYINIKNNSLQTKKTLIDDPSLFFPVFPTDCLIRNRKQLVNAYKNKDFEHEVVVDGTIDVRPHMLVFKTIFPRASIDTIYGKLWEKYTQKDEYLQKYIAEMNDLSRGKMTSNIEITLRKGVDPFDVLERIKKSMVFSRSWRSSMLFGGKRHTFRHASPIELLEAWYTERRQSILGDLNATQKKLVNAHRVIMALLTVVDYTEEVLAIFKVAKSPSDTIEPLCKRFKLTQYQAKQLAAYRLDQLTSLRKEELRSDAESIVKKIADLQLKFSTIDNTIVDEVKELKRKYGSQDDHRTRYTDFMGYVKTPCKGVIQFFDYKDLNKLMIMWDHELEVHFYPKGRFHKCLFRNGFVEVENDVEYPKEIPGDGFIVARNTKHVICLSRGQIYRLPSNRYDAAMSNTLTGDDVLFINRTGNVYVDKATTIILRGKVGCVGVKSDTVYVADHIADQYVVFHGHENDKNTIRVNLVAPGGKLNSIAMRGWMVIACIPYGTTDIINIPAAMLNRCSITQIVIDTKTLLGDETYIQLHLSRKLTSTGMKISQDKVSQLYMI